MSYVQKYYTNDKSLVHKSDRSERISPKFVLEDDMMLKKGMSTNMFVFA